MKKYLMRRYLGNIAMIAATVLISCGVAAFYGDKTPQISGTEQTANEGTALPVMVIDPGHGGADCGAVGINGILEKDVNLKLSIYLAEELEKVGYTVKLTRSEDVMLVDTEKEHTTKKSSDLTARVAAAREGDIFISVHMNKFPEEKYSGAQVYYSVNNEASYKLAQRIQEGICSSLQPDNTRVIKSGAGLFLLDRIDIPAVICECGFLSNKAEAEKLADEEYLRALAFEIFSAIDDFVIESCFQST